MLMILVRAAHLIRELNLPPHPEGGQYRETFCSTTLIADHGGQRRSPIAAGVRPQAVVPASA